MNRCGMDRNLLLFLDPAGARAEESWLFFEGCPRDAAKLLERGGNLACRFPRKRLPHLFLAWAALRLQGISASRVLFVNDGLLSCFLRAGNRKAYRLYARHHLSKPESLRRRLVSRLPLSLRCESTFLVLLSDRGSCCAGGDERALVEAAELMFFSNRLGKLLLLNARAIEGENGEIIKTTAHDGYLPVMEREYEILSEIAQKMTDGSTLPQLGRHFTVNGRHFFTERYVAGESLRDVLHRQGTRGEVGETRRILQLLDQWYSSYLGVFTGARKELSALTGHLLPLFTACYRGEPTELVESARAHLAELHRSHQGLVPVVSHNDLWPGNFLLTERGLVVLDWERATRERAPFFDYFWMIVSAALEYLAGAKGARYYADMMDHFFTAEDEVSAEAHRLLRLFLERLGIPDRQYQAVLFLFLMEGSVQGYQALGRQTDMDRLIYGQLLKFAAPGDVDGGRPRGDGATAAPAGG